VKLMENTYRDVNIAIANEFSRLAERFGVNVWEAIRIANHHPRVKILNPGIGVGGHCISVDPWFFVEAAPDITPLIHTTRVVNDGQPEFVLRIIQKTAGDLKGKKIGYLGLSFKANVDDLRESPAIELANLLVGCGAEVAAYEPHKCAGIYQGLQNVANLQKAVQDASIIVIAVGHQQFRDLRPVDLRKITSASLIFDPTNFLGNDEWKSYGFAIINLISK
jgi:UDP-N-acetyl-D-mannosaminuronic acid dehydrogenase